VCDLDTSTLRRPRPDVNFVPGVNIIIKIII
jgi:hypothetical protein